MTEEERIKHGVPEGALASICRGFLLSEYERILERGVPCQAAQDLLARTNTAIVAESAKLYQRNSQYHKKGDPLSAPIGRTWQWECDKQAEKGFYRMKALVDTTLTEQMKARANRVLRHIKGEVTEESGRLSAEEINEELFGPSQSPTDPDVIDGEVEESPEEGTKDPWTEELAESQHAEPEPSTNGHHDTTPADPAVVAQWRKRVARNPRPAAWTVGSAVANAVPYFENEHHALSYCDYESGDRLTKKEALELYDVLVATAEGAAESQARLPLDEEE